MGAVITGRKAGAATSLPVGWPSGGRLWPPTPGIKRLQDACYTQLQRAMLGQIGSDAALAEAELQWNRYADARWP